MMMTKYPTIPALDPLFKLTREDFFAPFESIMDDVFNGVLQEFPGAVRTGAATRLYPKTDIFRKENDLVFQACVPFTKKEDLKAELDRNVLTISGGGADHLDTVEKNAEGKVKYFRRELRRSRFTRSFTLPDDVMDKYESMDAVLVDGVLTITLKDAYKNSIEETPERKIIDIK